MNKKFVIGFFVLGIVLLVSAVLFFAVPQTVIGNQLSIDSCRSYVKDSWCSGGAYSCSDCSAVTLPYFISLNGVSTNKVYSADCVMGSNTGVGATGLPRTYCSQPSSITSHSYYQCVGNDVFWFNSNNVKETVKTSCSYRCHDDSLTTASCVTAPSCQSQGLSCGTPNLPSCCSGLSCQNFQCMPTTTTTPTAKSTYCSDTMTLCQNGAFDQVCTGGSKVNCPAGCDLTNKVCKTPKSNECPSLGFKECVLPSTFRQCISSNGYLQWDTTANCPVDSTCTDGVCHAFSSTNPSVTLPKCLDASFICMANPQTYNGELVSCDGYKCQYGCSNDVCSSAPIINPSCDVSSICSSSSKVLTTNADCTTKTSSCSDGTYCNGGSCIIIPVQTIASDSCSGVTCQDSCTADYTYQSQGSCKDGKCVYGGVAVMSSKCLSPISNVTSNLTNSITGDVVDNNVSMIKPTFLNTYGVWIAGGVFILSLIMFIIQFGKKPKRGRK